ncbi:MAG: hypothetical protein QW136_01085 [Nitrososphaerales archaeon]
MPELKIGENPRGRPGIHAVTENGAEELMPYIFHRDHILVELELAGNIYVLDNGIVLAEKARPTYAWCFNENTRQMVSKVYNIDCETIMKEPATEVFLFHIDNGASAWTREQELVRPQNLPDSMRRMLFFGAAFYMVSVIKFGSETIAELIDNHLTIYKDDPITAQAIGAFILWLSGTSLWNYNPINKALKEVALPHKDDEYATTLRTSLKYLGQGLFVVFNRQKPIAIIDDESRLLLYLDGQYMLLDWMGQELRVWLGEVIDLVLGPQSA